MIAEILTDSDFPLSTTLLQDLIAERTVDGVHWGPSHIVVHWDKMAETAHLDAHDRAAVRCIQAIAALELARGAGSHTRSIRDAILKALNGPGKR